MTKGTGMPDGRESGVAVQLVTTSPGRQAIRVAIALPKEPPPSNYIPMRSHVLVDRLAKRFSPKDASRLSMLCKRIGLRCALRLEDSFSKADHVYAMFDPDSDPVTERDSRASRTVENLNSLTTDLDTLLEMAGFQPVPQEFIQISKGADRLRGFRVQHPPPESLKIKMYYQRLLPIVDNKQTRKADVHSNFIAASSFVDLFQQFPGKTASGTSGKPHLPSQNPTTASQLSTAGMQVERKHWLMPWVRESVQEMQYGSLFAIFQRLEVPERPSWFQRLWAAMRPAPAAAAEAEVLLPQPEPPEPPVHLRAFRSVALHDADMLVPGAKARFTLLDRLLVWVPIAIGVCSALYKILTSTLEFTPGKDPASFATTLALVLMPLSYAVQARASLQRRTDDCKADIDELLLMRQRSSIAGALQWLLDTATEQEQKEMLLAYVFLWGGRLKPLAVVRDTAKNDIDAAIERFLNNDILLAEGGDEQMAEVDFDMADALGDITREGLVLQTGGGETLQAVPLADAVDAMSIRRYPEEMSHDRVTLAARHWLLRSKHKRAGRAAQANGGRVGAGADGPGVVTSGEHAVSAGDGAGAGNAADIAGAGAGGGGGVEDGAAIVAMHEAEEGEG